MTACASGNGRGDDDTPPDPEAVPIRSCATHFALRPVDAVEQVAVAGDWDWNAPEPMADADGDGEFTLDKDLAPGIHAYKFVLTRPGGAVDWILDPVNQYRAYDSGTENSGARVPDCTPPLAQVDGNELTADGAITRIALWRGKDGAALGDVRVARRFEGAEFEVPTDALVRDGGLLTVTLAGLPAGKHTLEVDVSDVDGHAAERLLVPFWVETERFDWRDALIYMVMTDRFRNGDPANDPPRNPAAVAEADYHGGDLRGVAQAIEDGTFDQLGVRALWLSPFVENTRRVHDENGHGVTGYHGYWPVKARAIDPRLGTEADLDALVTAAHRHGIRVLMDYVINHVHEDHEYFATHPEWFRTGCECGTPGCDWTEHRLDCSFHDYMPDVDWQRRDVSEQMLDDAQWWVERFDLDGLRVDAVKHVEDLAIFNLSTRIHDRFETGGTEYFLLGETAMGWGGDNIADSYYDYQTISRYIGDRALSGQFDFVLYHATTTRVWADETRGMLHLDYWTRASLEQYPTTAVMTPFVGSHDATRLISMATYGSGAPLVHHKWADQGLPDAPTTDEPYDKVALALAWTLTIPGAPLLYYGDEYGEHGGDDPDNRHMWVAPAQRTARQTHLFDRVSRVGQLRQQLAPLRRGSYQPLTVTEDVLSFARNLGNDSVIVVINHAAQSRSAQIAAPFPDGTYTDRMDPAGRTVTLAGGQLSIEMAPRSVAILSR
ncbi:MAG TPA: alpha-amylase family glycosyl hydrolase [Kofleriaceae bacterium]|nr:alpha-amylase family glycosyl hydrolase [Kofleriaceae bacterium]